MRQVVVRRAFSFGTNRPKHQSTLQRGIDALVVAARTFL